MKRALSIILLFIGAFLLGNFVAHLQTIFFPQTIPTSAGAGWGLSFQEEGEPPVADATKEDLAKYDAYYMGDSDKKVLYLTFDAGYENGNTAPILDALKKHKAPAAFFVVGTYIEQNPELIKRMVSENHLVGNHTYHHKNMAQIADKKAFLQELQPVESMFKDLTGEEMPKLYRPPQGVYNETNLRTAQELGYHTFFWSLAYVDWNQNNQPSKEEALDKLLSRVHPGAIVLLHSTSSTNAAILNELLTKWEEMGYEFRSLKDFTSA